MSPRRITIVATALFFALFAVLVATSNMYDWDFFFTGIEVDRRSWVLDHLPPLWSYQFCAGVTRWGDPQSFGLSPLFIIPMLVGSFWGAKLFLVLSAAVGVVFHRRILLLVAPKGDELALTATSLLYVFGNYFLWHAYVGQVTFAVMHWALVPIWLTLKSVERPLTRKELAFGALIVWAIFSGGIYHSFVFLIMPFYLAFALHAAWRLARTRNPAPLRGLVGAAGFHLAGLALAGYKLYGVARYQSWFPRTAPAAPFDSVGPLKLLTYQLLPTVGFELFPPVDPHPVYGMWEYSAFSLLPWCLLALAALVRPRLRPPRAWIGGLVAIHALLVAWLCLGDHAFSLHTLLNKAIFRDSLRVCGRYQAGLCFALSLAVAALVTKAGEVARARRALPALFTAALALGLVNFATFAGKTGTRILAAVLTDDPAPESRMTRLAMVEERVGNMSYMFRAVRHNLGVLNCYDALAHFDIVEKDQAPDSRAELPLLAPAYPGSDKPGAACLARSFFTQNELNVDASCPRKLCLNLNSPNLYDWPEGFVYDAKRRRFCRD